METSSRWGKWQFVIAGRRQACEVEQMSLLLSRGLFVRVTLETEIFQFPVRHLEPIMACHVFPCRRCAAAGLIFLHDGDVGSLIIKYMHLVNARQKEFFFYDEFIKN